MRNDRCVRHETTTTGVSAAAAYDDDDDDGNGADCRGEESPGVCVSLTRLIVLSRDWVVPSLSLRLYRLISLYAEFPPSWRCCGRRDNMIIAN